MWGTERPRQGPGHTAGKMVTMGGGVAFTPRSFAINTPEHLYARNWGPQNRGLSPCLQSRGDFPSTGLPQKGGRRTEAQVPRGALTMQGPGGLTGGLVMMRGGQQCESRGVGLHARPRQGQGLGLVDMWALDLACLLGLFFVFHFFNREARGELVRD